MEFQDLPGLHGFLSSASKDLCDLRDFPGPRKSIKKIPELLSTFQEVQQLRKLSSIHSFLWYAITGPANNWNCTRHTQSTDKPTQTMYRQVMNKFQNVHCFQDSQALYISTCLPVSPLKGVRLLLPQSRPPLSWPPAPIWVRGLHTRNQMGAV